MPSFYRYSKVPLYNNTMRYAYLLIFLVCSLLGINTAHAQYVTTIAGNGIWGYSGDGGPATMASLKYIRDVAVDDSGNVFISGEEGNCIRKINTNGIITCFAGIPGNSGFSGDNGPATNAQITYCMGLGVDKKGNLYIADFANQRIRKVDAFGIITTIAGNGGIGYTGDNGPATNATMHDPNDAACDKWGNVYFTDDLNNCIRKIDTSGIITTVAGTGIEGQTGDNGPATAAQITRPLKLDTDTFGNVYFTTRCVVRKIDLNGIITTIAGNGTGGCSGDEGPATAAQIASEGIAIGVNGYIYTSEQTFRCVREITSDGIIHRIAGVPTMAGYSGDGGPATAAVFVFTPGVAVDRDGYVYIVDQTNYRIRKTYQHTINVENADVQVKATTYPSPCNGSFILQITTAQPGAIPIYLIDMTGRIVHSEQVLPNQPRAIATSLPTGIYAIYTTGTYLGNITIEH